jgi:DNA-directed RNA polymerase subunit RPC12/RpoP
MTNTYQQEWEAYRTRKRNLIVLLIAQFFALIPFLMLVALIDRKLFSATSLVMPAAIAWGLWYLSTIVRLRIFPCPRCGKNFFGGGSLTGPMGRRTQECVYCGLHIFADS